jgi:uncharacterized protein (DUF1786 family)
MRGDKVTVVVDAGTVTREFEIEATKKGRKVEVRIQARTTDVVEVDQGGNDIRTCRFRNDRIIALVEHKVEEASAAEYQRRLDRLPGMTQ